MLLRLLLLAASVQAAVPPPSTGQLYASRKHSASRQPYILPTQDKDIAARTRAIQFKRANFVYGASPVGDSAFYPNGTLGKQLAEQDVKDFYADIEPFLQTVEEETAAAYKAAKARGGLKTLNDYAMLYQDEWKTSVPAGVDPGMLSNYTDDRLFAMERLSTSPLVLARLHPETDLPFQINDTIAEQLAGQNMSTLHQEGRLFYIDWQDQQDLPRLPGRYSAPCDAYFFIHPTQGDFRPLAIRAHTDTDLIYSPLDDAEDWLLAKMMFNTADLWGSQFYHLVNTHDLAEIIYQSAIRTLDDKHPVLGIMNRLNFQAFSMRPAASYNLTNPGGAVDQLFPHPGTTVPIYAKKYYLEKGAGAVRGNYLYENVRARGLVDCKWGPPLQHFPFFEDARAIYDEIRVFMTKFVDSYYPNPKAVVKDRELQAWLLEATDAEIIDFPPAPMTNSTTLVDLLSFVAYLVGVSHQVQNTNDPIGSVASLPFHTAAFWKPLPTEKGVKDVAQYLPPLEQSIGQISLMAGFCRARWAGGNRTIVHMFDDPAMLGRLNEETRDANLAFQEAMKKVSEQVSSRTFDKDGLSQGMPFVWKVLDPNQATFYLTV